MRIDVDVSSEKELLQRARELNTDPESLAKTLLECAGGLHEFWSVARNSSLDDAMDELTDNLEMAFMAGDLIRRVVGDRTYRIESCGCDLENDAFSLDLYMGSEEMDYLIMQFGRGAMGRVTASMTDVTNMDDGTRARIRDILGDGMEFEENWDSGYLRFSLRVPGDGYNMPRLDNFPVVRIKDIIRSRQKD